MKKTIILDLDVSFSHVKFQVCRMKRSEVTAVSAGEVFSRFLADLGALGQLLQPICFQGFLS